MSSLSDPKTLSQLVQKAIPNSQLQHTWSLKGGISNEMIAIEVQPPDGQPRRLVVRAVANSVAAKNEFRLLQAAHEWGLKTPKPYWLELSAEVVATPCLIIEHMAGEMTFAPNELDKHLQQMAIHLAHIHSLDLAQHDLTFLPQQNEGVCEALKQPGPLSSLDFPQVAKIRTVLTTEDPRKAQNKKALLHGDYWPGNSLWQNGELTAVIDWEDAMLGDPVIDLARSRSEIAWIFGLEAVTSFTQHYQQQMTLDLSALPFWDLCAALRQIRLLGDDLTSSADYFVDYGRTDITPQSIRQNLNSFIDHALAQFSR